jgi:2-polyprenyl-3-methyl-5-hydroxy-6-metoxy-1,4-benzoquinol methylase
MNAPLDREGRVKAEFYDDNYFTDLNGSGHHYTLENRRKIEGKHPQQIVDTFGNHIHVIDCACGPGILIHLLRELGVNAHGFDFAPGSIATAPEETKKFIWRARIDQERLPHSKEDSYDLVICRETFEHLTPYQVFLAIRLMKHYCRRGGHIYMTCRISKDDNPLHIETDFDVDPSHVCLHTRAYLEFLFEKVFNLIPRKDLEAKMDHQNKGRCFVYEKA